MVYYYEYERKMGKMKTKTDIFKFSTIE